MLEVNALQRAELYFRTYLHTVMPLHITLSKACAPLPRHRSNSQRFWKTSGSATWIWRARSTGRSSRGAAR